MSSRPKSSAPRPPVIEVPAELQPLRNARQALRATFLAELPAAQARMLDQAIATALVADCEPLDFPGAVEAAADDLAAAVAELDPWADNHGDGIDRHEIRLAGAVLDAVPVIAGQAAALRAHARRARRDAGAPAAPPAELPEPPECSDSDRPAGMPDVVPGHQAADAALRATYQVALRERDAQRFEQIVRELANEDDSAVSVPYLRSIAAAAVDLLNVAAFLDYMADDRDDGVERHEIPTAALVLETYPEVERLARRLLAAVERAGVKP